MESDEIGVFRCLKFELVSTCLFQFIVIFTNTFFVLQQFSVFWDLFFITDCRQLRLIWDNFEMVNINNTHLNQHPDPATDYP